MAFYVFDLDGTLADCHHRLHFIDKDRDGGPDWRKFFAACPGDRVIPHVEKVMWSLWKSWNRIEIWSGRSDEVRAATIEWLESNRIPSEWLTHMRKAGDHRPDDVIKREFLSLSEKRPDVVFDDRRRVVDMWRAEGIPCFQVAEGEF